MVFTQFSIHIPPLCSLFSSDLNSNLQSIKTLTYQKLKELYIIGHNANSINEAIEHLSDGANGLQADICFIPNTFEKFYLHEKQPVSEFEVTELYGMIKDGEVTSLKNFLHEVSWLLGTNPRFRLSMIFLNLIQPYVININELFGIV